MAGLFIQVSGMSYSFNPKAKVSERVQSVDVGGEKIDEEKKYTVACRARLAFGQGKRSSFAAF